MPIQVGYFYGAPGDRPGNSRRPMSRKTKAANKPADFRQPSSSAAGASVLLAGSGVKRTRGRMVGPGSRAVGHYAEAVFSEEGRCCMTGHTDGRKVVNEEGEGACVLTLDRG